MNEGDQANSKGALGSATFNLINNQGITEPYDGCNVRNS